MNETQVGMPGSGKKEKAQSPPHYVLMCWFRLKNGNKAVSKGCGTVLGGVRAYLSKEKRHSMSLLKRLLKTAQEKNMSTRKTLQLLTEMVFQIEKPYSQQRLTIATDYSKQYKQNRCLKL